MTSTNINIYQFLKKGKEAFKAENYGTATQLLTNVICIPELSSQHFEVCDYLAHTPTFARLSRFKLMLSTRRMITLAGHIGN